jgi:hypothetical protein
MIIKSGKENEMAEQRGLVPQGRRGGTKQPVGWQVSTEVLVNEDFGGTLL